MDRIHFVVNNKPCSVGSEVESWVTLNDYLRRHLNLHGTKYMCREGGCGACVVAVTAPDPDTGTLQTFSVNSCLVSITSTQGWEITTIEELGNKLKGYHELQKSLADHNGSQCGHCSPGWIMAMYSLLESKKNLNAATIENSFGSNICRCTGYRPILDAFKTFAKDAKVADEHLTDIEDLKICANTCKQDNEWCFINREEVTAVTASIQLKDNKKWFRVATIKDIFQILNVHGYDDYMLVSGNTAKGVYPIQEYPDILIDISAVGKLNYFIIDQNLQLSGGITLTKLMRTFENVASEHDYFSYLQILNEHVDLIAHIPVRNIATIAGNLMIKHAHPEFPSDIFLILETVNARITIENYLGAQQLVTPEAFLGVDMKRKIIRNVTLPPYSSRYKIATYKIMKRAQNSHAIVNAGFLYKLDADEQTVLEARIVYGGLSKKFVHAVNSEKYLVGKKLYNNETLQAALKILEAELNVDEMPPEPSAKARKKIALGLFYKGLLKLCPPELLNNRYKSGAENLRLTRPVSSGKQVFDTNPLLYPLNQPIPKVEGLIQCSGEALYVDDTPKLPEEVYAAFVLSTVATGVIDNIDSSDALKTKGVVAFLTSKDIPGNNNYTPLVFAPFHVVFEEVLCTGTVKYFSQPIGVILAESDHLANVAAEKVKITYRNSRKPVLTIKDAKKDSSRVRETKHLPAEARGSDVTKTINGSNNIFGQYHFTLELQVCLSYPCDDGLEIYPSSQWMDCLQVAVSEALNISENSIYIEIRRVGGGFGSKVTRSSQVGVTCSLVNYHLNRPCRLIMPLKTIMKAMGKRLPCSSDFQVAVNSKGVIQYLKHNIYEDNGYVVNEPMSALGLPSYNNVYDKTRWDYFVYDVTTDTASNSWCRAPGTLEQISMAEYIMEQISYEMSLDPIAVRISNLDEQASAIKEMTDSLKEKSDYENRLTLVKKYNEENRWKKRGLRYMPLSYPAPKIAYYNVSVSVYHNDGTVIITHGGVEIGQGINTKAIQVCAYTLKIPLSKVKVHASNVITNPNSTQTGGSITSESICLGVIKSCNVILDRLNPLRLTLGSPTWEVLVQAAFKVGVNLVADTVVNSDDANEYKIYGVSFAEVALDILTGETQILRVDLMEDVGQSLSPEIDVGQIEGAFIMGLGYWTSEELVYDKNSGELLSDRSWHYKPPGAKDIPIDFRTYFRRNTYNQLGILGSKATGEPATCLSLVVPFALRAALSSSREESGYSPQKWFAIDGPHTTANLVLAADTKLSEFKFK